MLEKGDNFSKLKDSGVDKVLWSWRTEPNWSDPFKEKLKRWKIFTARFIEGTYPEGEDKLWPNKEKRRMHNYGGEIDLGLWGRLTKKSNAQKKKTTLKSGAENMVGTRYPCYHLWFAPAVAWNGNFLMCCSDPHNKEVFGDIKIETVSQAWKRLDKVRTSHLEGKYEGICKSCDVWREYPSVF